MRIEGSGHWIHIASTPDLALYFAHKKRGSEAMKAVEVLPNYTGIAMHDGYVSYPAFDNCRHALCHAPPLRELPLLFEHYGQESAMWMMRLLKDTWRIIKHNKSLGFNPLSDTLTDSIRLRYDDIFKQAIKEMAQLAHPSPKKRGKPAQHPAKNLYDRLRKYKTQVLRFVYDFRVPFDNHQAERDIRMIKTQQKISGTVRTTQGAKVFGRIRSYISTLKKQSQNILQGIQAAIEDFLKPQVAWDAE